MACLLMCLYESLCTMYSALVDLRRSVKFPCFSRLLRHLTLTPGEASDDVLEITLGNVQPAQKESRANQAFVDFFL